MMRDAVRRHLLPNGIEVSYQSKAELLQFYDDIFEKRIYTRGGISLRDGDIVFDVGANVGLFTVFVALSCPGSQVFAFEPAPPIFGILQANVASYGDRIRLFPCGLSNRAGSAELTFYPSTSGMSSFYPDEGEETAALRTLISNQLASGKPGVARLMEHEAEWLEQRLRHELWTCPLKTLSQIVHEEGVTRIDLLKIDAEKSEMDILAGIAPEDWQKIEQVVMEAHERGDRRQQIEGLLRRHGFAGRWEQDELYRGSDRYNLYAIRDGLGAARSGSIERPQSSVHPQQVAERARRARDKWKRN
jgi:phthiocerol/phenolphthiocerol synthesis type-I polyketide synthase E